MPSTMLLGRRYDEAAAKAEYVEHLEELGRTQNLSQSLEVSTVNLSIVFTVLAAVFVAMRYLARWKQGVHIGLDDWLCVAALVLLFGTLIFNIVLVGMGVGLHVGAVPLDNLMKLNELMVGAEIIYVHGVNMYKISLLCLYFRIFPVRTIRKGGYICGGLSTAWTLACTFAASFQCQPRQKIWEPWVQGTCIDLFLTQLCISVPSIIVDIAILCLPIPNIWRLKTNLTQRIFLLFIFLLGSFVVFCSIYRFRIFLSYRKEDVTYTIAPGLAWNAIEISSGIISGCFPTLGPLVRPILKSINPSSLRSGSKSGLTGSKLYGGRSNQKSNLVATIGGGGGGGGGGDNGHNRDGKRIINSKYGIYDSNSDPDLVGGGGGGRHSPEHGVVGVTVTTTTKHKGTTVSDDYPRLSGDEIPLRPIIHRQIEVRQTEERIQPGGGSSPTSSNFSVSMDK